MTYPGKERPKMTYPTRKEREVGFIEIRGMAF